MSHFTYSHANGPRRYVWANLDIDIIDIRKSHFRDFKPVAHLIRRLKFERDLHASRRNYFYYEIKYLCDFVDVEEFHIVGANGSTTSAENCWIGRIGGQELKTMFESIRREASNN